MQKIEFQEFDAIGEETLDAMGQANRFNRWMYQTIKPSCKGRVLEIGSGAGNISEYFLKDGFEITLTDIRENYCQKLHRKFGDTPNLSGIVKMNLTDSEFKTKHKNLLGTFDTVFALNVVEHIEDDFMAIKNCYKLLKKGGNLIILVPSYQAFYNRFDIGLGHYRRYNKRSLADLFLKNNFEIIHKQYFNFIGLFGWYVSGSILKKKIIPSGQVNLFNKLVPVFKVIDKLILQSMGLSTIIVGRK